MNLSRKAERALALAGLLQSCYLVANIARTGLVGQDSLTGSLDAVFVTNPETALDVYRGGNGVRTGLRLLYEILGEFRISEHGDVVRYAMAVLALEKRLQKTPEVMRELGAGLSRVAEIKAVEGVQTSQESIITELSDLYEKTAGTSEPRIRVLGQQKHLAERSNTLKIRALLLAALRSAVLWRQVDGRLSECLLGRRKLLAAANKAELLVNNINVLDG